MRHAHQRTRGIEQVDEQERKNHAQHGHVQRAHQIHGHEGRGDGRRHGHDATVLIVAQHHGGDGHTQNTDHHRTGHAQVGQRGNHEKAQQGVNGRRLRQVAQRHVSRRIGHHDTGIFQGNHRQEQADTRRNPQSQRQRDRVDDPLAHLENAQQKEGQAREEHRPQRGFPGVAHSQHHAVGKEGVQAHSGCLGNGVVGPKAHHETANGRRQTRRHEHGTVIHAGFRKDARVDEDDVGHRKERGDPCNHLGFYVGLLLGELEVVVQKFHIVFILRAYAGCVPWCEKSRTYYRKALRDASTPCAANERAIAPLSYD